MTSPVWHPFTQHGLNETIPLVTHNEGAALFTQDGRRIVDAISSWWVTTHGHRHPRIMAAIAEQAQRLDQIIFAGWTHQPAEDLARGLTAIMPAERMMRRFFSKTVGQTTRLAMPLSSSSVMNMTPLALPGRWRTSTMPAASSHRPSRASMASVQVTMRLR